MPKKDSRKIIKVSNSDIISNNKRTNKVSDKNTKNVKVIKLSGNDNNNGKLNLPKLNKDEYKQNEFKSPSEFLSLKDLKNKLVNYEQVNYSDIKDLPNGTRISYFEVMNIDGERKFKYKVGGNIISNGYPKYLYLTNGRANWSVQLENHIIFKLNTEDIKSKYEKIIKKLETKISLLESENKDLFYKYSKLKNKVKLNNKN